MTQIEHDDSAPAALVKLAYGYDPVGNRKYKQDLTSGLSTWSELYEYDGLHRLRNFKRGTLNSNHDDVSTPVSEPFVKVQQWVEFDLVGNWLETYTATEETRVTEARTINSVNEYSTRDIEDGPSYTLDNDDNGNLTDDGTQVYVYDGENRLIEVRRKGDPDVSVQTYAYDALARRVKTVDHCPEDCDGGVCSGVYPDGGDIETWHVYGEGPACLEEYHPGESNTLLRYFVHGTSFPDPLAMIDNTDAGASGAGTHEFFWYLKDALGSVVALKNASDAVVERYAYDAYGKTVVTNSSGTPLSANGDCNALEVASAYGNPFCWTGQRYDPRVGLYHFWFRSYSPALGRWLQRDPAGYPDGLSLYEYARSRAVVLVDPRGLTTPGYGGSDGICTSTLGCHANSGSGLGWGDWGDDGGGGSGLCFAAGSTLVAAPKPGVTKVVFIIGIGIVAIHAIVDIFWPPPPPKVEPRPPKPEPPPPPPPKPPRRRPPGDCTPDEYEALRAAVVAACKSGESTKCEPSPNQDCDTLYSNFKKNMACEGARRILSARCFGNDDPDHDQPANNAGQAATKCMALYIAKCWDR